MRIIFVAFSVLLISILGIIYFKPEYNSAFEADQQCHYEISNFYMEKANLGCDHDLETRQWILYSIEDTSLPANVIKRFSY